MAYNILHKLSENIAAIRIALNYKQGDVISVEQQQILSRYNGFGGIKAVLFSEGTIEDWASQGAKEGDLRLHDRITELYDLLKSHFNEQEFKDVVSLLKESVLTAFYTPSVIPQTLFEAMKKEGIIPFHLYEPSAGSGVFLMEGIKAFAQLEQVTAVEKDLLTGKILKAIAGSSIVPTTVHICGLEEAPRSDNGSYDFIVSNIPFGNFSVYDPEFPQKEISGKIHTFLQKGWTNLVTGD